MYKMKINIKKEFYTFFALCKCTRTENIHDTQPVSDFDLLLCCWLEYTH